MTRVYGGENAGETERAYLERRSLPNWLILSRRIARHEQ